MNWIAIVYCTIPQCMNKTHIKVNNRKVCNLKTIPSTKGEYLVSDGLHVGIAEYELLFSNFDYTDRVVKNSEIKYWRSLRKFNFER